MSQAEIESFVDLVDDGHKVYPCFFRNSKVASPCSLATAKDAFAGVQCLLAADVVDSMVETGGVY